MSDIIRRQDAIDAIEAQKADEWIESDVDFNHGMDMARSIVATLPSAEAVHGDWIEVEVFPEVYDIEGVKTWGSEMQCDQCGFRHTAIEGHMAQYNFCPNCGARMTPYKGGDEE